MRMVDLEGNRNNIKDHANVGRLLMASSAEGIVTVTMQNLLVLFLFFSDNLRV